MVDLSQAIQYWRGGRPNEAEREVNALLQATPEDSQALRFLAEIYGATGRASQSIQIWRRLCRLQPTDAGLLRQLAQVLLTQREYREAIERLRTALTLDPDNARAYNNLGLAQLRSGDANSAAASLEQAVRVDARYALAYMNLGMAREQLGRLQEACSAYEQALQVDPHLQQARARLSELLRTDDPSAARRERHRALESHAINLMTVSRHDAAIPIWTQLIGERAELDFMMGTRFHCQLQCCDWSEYTSTCARIEADVLAGRRVDLPFSFFVHSSSAAGQLQCARTFIAARFAPPVAPPLRQRKRSRSARIHICYLSADFHEHATSYLIAGVLEHHDRAKFEITALSYGMNDGSAMRARIEKAVDRFVDVARHTDSEIVTLMRDLDVQVAVDLKGLTGGGRTGILAQRAAPVQVNFLGYPGTMGADYIDYVIADRHVIPESDRQHYAEDVLYLPQCYQPNDLGRPLPPKSSAASRQELGLPPQGFVFCCFNNVYKITPATFAVWMDLLRKVAGSVLWLLQGPPMAMTNLHKAAATAGIDPRRIVFAPHIALEQHLARYHHADLFLDTSPCNAHTTASDALWMGVPVLTMTGAAFAGRVATSLVHAVGLSEMCVRSMEQYADKALQLATVPGELAALKDYLRNGRSNFALFDTASTCRNIENLYEEMVARLAPELKGAVEHE